VATLGFWTPPASAVQLRPTQQQRIVTATELPHCLADRNPFLALAGRQTPAQIKVRLQAVDKRRSKAEEPREQETAKLSKLYHLRRQQEFDDALLLARMRSKGLALHSSHETAGQKWRLSNGTRYGLINNNSIDTLFAGVGVGAADLPPRRLTTGEANE